MHGNQSRHATIRRKAGCPGMWRSDYSSRARRYIEWIWRKHVRQNDRLTLIRLTGIVVALTIM